MKIREKNSRRMSRLIKKLHAVTHEDKEFDKYYKKKLEREQTENGN